MHNIVPNLDTREIVDLPLDRLVENEKNFFLVNDIDELKESIQLNGILQPLLVVEAGSRFRIVAGHRRLKAARELGLATVPAVILPEMSEAKEWMVLIQTNTASRELLPWEKLEAVRRLKSQLLQLKEEGHVFHGRLRDQLAEQLEISKSEIARLEVIDKRLCPEGKELMKAGQLSASAAYAMARAPEDLQREIIDDKPAAFVASVIEERIEKSALDWMEPDCPHPSGWWQCEEKRAGRALPCPAWEKIKAHKAKGHPEDCCGCCAKCEKYKHGYSCPDVCQNFREVNLAKIRAEAAEKDRQKRAEQRAADEAHFSTTPFVSIGKAVLPLVESGEWTMDDIAEWWTDELDKLTDEADPDLEGFDAGQVASFLYAKVVGDVEWPLSAFVAFCRAVDKTPNELLGYPSGSGWKDYPENCPDENQMCVVRRSVAGVSVLGEYLYSRDQWYFPGDDPEMDEAACLSGEITWTEVPD